MSPTIKTIATNTKNSSQKTVKNVGLKKRIINPNLSKPMEETEKVFCRLCLGMINDYPADIWEAGLSEDILLCCAIEVSPSDSYTHLCPSCLNNLKQCVQFRLMCSKNNCIYLQLKTIKEEKSSVTCDTSTEMSQVNIDSHSAVKRNAFENVKTEIKLEIESVKKIDASDGAGYELEIIFKKENTDDDSVPNDDPLNMSDYINADLEGSHAEETDLREEQKELACLKCPVICADEQEYEVHCESHKPLRDPQGCYILCKLDGCREKFKTVRDRKAHTLDKHGARGPQHLCYVCGGMVRHYANHLRTTHKDLREKVPAKCELCSKEYPNSFRLQQHIKVVHKSSGCMCPICGITVRTKIGQHMREVHFQKDKYSCLYCDKKSGKSYNMRVHMRTHTGELPFACPDCSLQFSHRVTMKQHRLQVHHVDMFQRPPPTTLATTPPTKRPKKFKKKSNQSTV